MKPIIRIRQNMKGLTNFKRRNELRQGYQQKEHVKEKLELVKKYYRNESNDIIFLILDFVASKTSRLSFSIHP